MRGGGELAVPRRSNLGENGLKSAIKVASLRLRADEKKALYSVQCTRTAGLTCCNELGGGEECLRALPLPHVAPNCTYSVLHSTQYYSSVLWSMQSIRRMASLLISPCCDRNMPSLSRVCAQSRVRDESMPFRFALSWTANLFAVYQGSRQAS